MIASFFDGRVRVRHPALRDEKVMGGIKNLLAARDGILNTTENLRTGSLLILYDPRRISGEDLLAACALLEKQLDAKPAQDDKKQELSSRDKENLLYAALFLLTAGSGVVSRSLHIGTGLLLSLMTMRHMSDRNLWKKIKFIAGKR
ncbi:MAG: hypothetical protein LBN33_07495 [Desulfovibrio sp.]|jgi:hypothetical protein|nr:hypothetical protein [Desulfovibrio sp.]